MPDVITILTHPTLPLAKRWEVDGSITPYSSGKTFAHKTETLDGIQALHQTLSRLEKSSRSCIIRGVHKGEDYARSVIPAEDYRVGHTYRQLDFFNDPPHHWLLLEIDNFEPMLADPQVDPVAAIEEYLTELPPEFWHVSYHWQLSNSAGAAKYRDVLKAHVWVWLHTPYTSAQLRAWVKACKIPFDYATLNPVQVHYTAAPLFAEGVDDPLPARSGFVQKDNDEVDFVLPDNLPVVDKESRKERLRAAHQDDVIAQMLYDQGRVLSVGNEGQLNIECPLSERHTAESGETATVYFPANTGGYSEGAFVCLHAHCVDAAQNEFHEALGILPADDFETLSDELPEKKLADLEDRLALVHAADFAAHLSPTSWLVRGVLPAADLAMIYGPSGSGKTFITLDLGMAVAQGIPWRDKPVTKGRVVYVVAEGANGFRKRLRGYALHHRADLSGIDLFVLPGCPSLLDKKDLQVVVESIKQIGGARLVILDTLQQVTAGGNENSGEDMGKAMRHAQLLGQAVGATVLLVHHTGKDETRGSRGWSGLKGVLDAELEVIRSDNDRCLTVTKLKDGEGEGVSYGFSLAVVDLGLLDEAGEAETSCAVDHMAGTVTPEQIRQRRKMGRAEQAVAEMVSLLADDGDGWVTIAAVVEAMQAHGRRADNTKRCIGQLVDAGRLEQQDMSVREIGEDITLT